MHLDLLIITLTVFLIFLILKIYFIKKEAYENFHPNPVIYCIMITGKDDQRLCFAKRAINNFHEQDYSYKKLIIINHNSTPVYYGGDDVEEFPVPISTTLGDMRNIALQMVPINACWTIWDDDDYRTNDYLSLLQSQMKKSKCDVVLFTNRLECNYNNKSVWRMQLRTGFVTVLAKQDLRIKYKSVDTMEDTNLIYDLKSLGKKLHVWNNETTPEIYVRLIHNNNTSLFVQKDKSNPSNSNIKNNYNEFDIDKQTQEKVMNFILNHFKGCLENLNN